MWVQWGGVQWAALGLVLAEPAWSPRATGNLSSTDELEELIAEALPAAG